MRLRVLVDELGGQESDIGGLQRTLRDTKGARWG
jgi:hypothetical protein